LQSSFILATQQSRSDETTVVASFPSLQPC